MPEQTWLQERRSAAAKKAWQTRRRLAKPSETMRKALEVLSRPDRVLNVHFHEGLGCTSISLSGSTGVRVTFSTFKALKKRKWIAFDREDDCGGTMGKNTEGKWVIVRRSFNRKYVISQRGRKAI
jgi:hypothetical protein